MITTQLHCTTRTLPDLQPICMELAEVHGVCGIFVGFLMITSPQTCTDGLLAFLRFSQCMDGCLSVCNCASALHQVPLDKLQAVDSM